MLILLGFFGYKSYSTPESLEGAQKVSNLGNQHIESPESEHIPYNSNPPTSGPHVGNIAEWGVSTEIIPDEIQVHNLEDGGVVIQYNPDKISKEEITALEEIVKTSSRQHLLLAPRYKMGYNIALTAWTRLLPLETVDEIKIKDFIDKFEGIDHHVRY